MPETKTIIHLKIETINDNVVAPKYATPGSAGVDLQASIEQNVILKPMSSTVVPTGIKIALPTGYEAQVRSRSGLAAKHSVMVLNSPGTIDSDYRGEIKVILINLGSDDFIITPKMKIAQMVIAQFVTADIEIIDSIAKDTERGSGGFGSTGM